MAFDNLRKVNSLISLVQQTVLFFPKLDSFCVFLQSPYRKLSKLNPKLDRFQKLKNNSCADNVGLTDYYIIRLIN